MATMISSAATNWAVCRSLQERKSHLLSSVKISAMLMARASAAVEAEAKPRSGMNATGKIAIGIHATAKRSGNHLDQIAIAARNVKKNMAVAGVSQCAA